MMKATLVGFQTSLQVTKLGSTILMLKLSDSLLLGLFSIVKCSLSGGKRMVATFFSQGGHMATLLTENQQAVNTEWYTNIFLPQVHPK
jgi:hypothetical protein